MTDQDQRRVLYVYSLYTDESKNTYLQYTAACALIYHLSQKGFFDYNLNELLVYDYKEERRYIWESKKFMTDINILRDQQLLLRARSRSKTSHDVNAHQCSIPGHQYIQNLIESCPECKEAFALIKKELTCETGVLKTIKLTSYGPLLVCRTSTELIKGFLKCFMECSENRNVIPDHNPFFI